VLLVFFISSTFSTPYICRHFDVMGNLLFYIVKFKGCNWELNKAKAVGCQVLQCLQLDLGGHGQCGAHVFSLAERTAPASPAWQRLV
jgi:hypothetical protein